QKNSMERVLGAQLKTDVCLAGSLPPISVLQPFGLFSFLETELHHMASYTVLPQSLQCWDCRPMPPSLSTIQTNMKRRGTSLERSTGTMEEM
ncbi:mCG15773, isoform CRA_a, partial [Mus musculus]